MNYETTKILICDDSNFARRNLKQILLSLGINTIIEAANGKEVIEKYSENMPDIVFMDIAMPKLSGVETLKAIFKINSKAKVVMLSSFGTQENLKEAIDVGAFDFIQKPVTEEKLVKLFHDLQNRS